MQHYLYASSYAVYGNTGPACLSESDSSQNAKSPYAAAKLEEEIATAAWCQIHGISATALRLFNVYGAGGRPGTMPMFFAEKMTQCQPLPLFQNGEVQRDFVHVDDVAEAILRLIPSFTTRSVGSFHRIFNIGSGVGTPIRTFVELLAANLGQACIVESKPLPPTEPLVTYANIAHLQDALAWKPEIPLSDGLVNFANWYRNCCAQSIKE